MATSGPSPFVQFFIASQLIGAILLIVVVTTVLLSRRIHRNVTWINLCITWIISALSYSLLTFAGRQSGPQPSPELCMTQSILIYGAPLVTTTAAFTLIIQLYYDLSSALSGMKKADPKRDLALCAGPYVLYIGVMIAAIIYGRDQTAERATLGTYCHFTSGSFGSFVAVAVVVILTTNFSILGYLIIRLYRLYGSSKGGKTRANLQPVIKGITRIAILKVAVLFPIVVSMIFLGNERHRNLFDAMIATMPLLTFLVFGLQTDILQAWCFWRGPAENPIENEPVSSESTKGVQSV